MKEINELNIPNDCLYSDDHEWAKDTGDCIRVGISDYAQDQLGDIVYVELPVVGDRFDMNQEFGVVESVKAVSDLLIPVSGEVIAVNSDLESAPNLVNESSHEKGWMIDIKPASTEEKERLMDKTGYVAFLRGE